ncbi:hypothetical protein NKJ28_00280 [Mesorhizobium sp. M0145]|uniref:hypothetical protein n=1 Tax=Mesorhizobium sp. M0145 TaxID=2956895 RepID=UPI00333577CD
MRAALLVAILAATSPALAFEPHSVNQAQEKAIQDGVKESLKDPDSAKFKGLLAIKQVEGADIACGLVNAKNSFGGYGGFTPFHGLLLTYKSKAGQTAGYGFFTVTIGGGTISAQSVYDWCVRDGINL